MEPERIDAESGQGKPDPSFTGFVCIGGDFDEGEEGPPPTLTLRASEATAEYCALPAWFR